MRIAVCDDQKEFLECALHKMRKEAVEQSLEASITVFSSGKSFLSDHRRRRFDLVFLDIDMPEVSGFEVAQKIREFNDQTVILFLTGNEEMVYESFQYQPFRFLRKSHFQEELPEALKSAVAFFCDNDRFYICAYKGEQIRLKINEIMYIESDRNKIMFHTQRGNFEELKSIGQIANELPDSQFIRIHKSFIVNYKFIKGISDCVTLDDGTKLPVSRSKLGELKQKLGSYLGGTL